MSPRLLLPTCATALVALAFAASSAHAANTYKQSFAPSKAGQSAGLVQSGTFDGTRIIDRLTTVLPKGTKVDVKAAPQCPANLDAKVDAQAPGKGYGELCAANTRVGTGSGSALVGDATTPTKFDLDFYNTSRGMYVDLKIGDTVAFTSFYAVRGRQLLFNLSLAPEIKAKITGFSIKIAKKGTAAKPYIRTPTTCPSSGRLDASVLSRAAGKTETTKTKVNCKR